MIDQTDALGLFRREQVAGQQVFLGARIADELRQMIAPPSPAT
jgi:hypothetical protein